jgi:pimeloyl-ACP methyl ester carboxylesterase
MMPFSVLRIWGLGLFSWLLLGAAGYLLYEYADGVSPPLDPDAVTVRADGTTEVDETRLPTDRQLAEQDTQGGWHYLLGGLTLLALSFGGFLPMRLLLGKPKFDEPVADRTGRPLEIDRPDGSRLHVEIYGAETSPTLILTHGWSLDSTSWYYLKRQFAGRYRLVVWDLRGLGQSKGPRNGDYRIETMAEDLNAVIAGTSFDRQVILVGHSIGGMITQCFCRIHSEALRSRVAGIVLLHTTYTNPLRTAWLAPLWTALEKPLLVPLNYLTMWLAPLAWLSNWQSYLNGSMHVMTRIASFAGGQTAGQVDYGAKLAACSWPGVVARGNLAMLEFDEQATLPRIDVPTLVVGSEYDRMTKREASDRIDQLAAHSVETVIPAGHLGFWERNEQFAEILTEFIDKNATNSPAQNAAAKAIS